MSSIGDWVIEYDQIEIKEKIGKGSSCMVFKGILKNRGTPIAIKKISVSEIRNKSKRFLEFKREIGTLIKIRPHQNLVLLMGVS